MEIDEMESRTGYIGPNIHFGDKTNLYMSSANKTSSDPPQTMQVVPPPEIKETFRLHNKI